MHPFSTYYTSSSDVPIINEVPYKLFLESNPKLTLTVGSTFCEICSGDDPILLLNCEVCGVVVHNYCYGVQIIARPWICQACIYTLQTKELTYCRVCSSPQGAKRKEYGGWVHSVCDKWSNPGLHRELRCRSCGGSDLYCVECEDCQASYHPYCGVSRGMRKVEGKIKCAAHSGGERISDGKAPRYIVNEFPMEGTLVIDTVFSNKETSKKPYKRNKTKGDYDDDDDYCRRNGDEEGKQEILENLVVKSEECDRGKNTKSGKPRKYRKISSGSKVIDFSKYAIDGKELVCRESFEELRETVEAKVGDKIIDCKEASTLTQDPMKNSEAVEKEVLGVFATSESKIDNDLYVFNKNIQKLLKDYQKSTKIKLSNKLECYLFSNSVLKPSCYELPRSLQKIFKRTSIFYHEFPDAILTYSTLIPE